MKKSLIRLVVLVLVLGSLQGCSSKKGSGDKTSKDTFKVGIVQPMDHPSLNTIKDSIVAELEAAGMKDKIEIIYKNANGDTTLLPSIMQSLVSDSVDMIVPIGTTTAQAAAVATTTIPIVFSAVSDPVVAGLVPALDQVDGNISGVSDAIPIEDIFKLRAELTPDVKTFGFVYNSSEINSIACIELAKAYCDANGLSYKEATITSTGDIQQAATSLIGDVDAFFSPIDNTVATAMPTFAQIANDAGIPIYVSADSMVNDGGLATVGIDYTVLGKQTAEMMIRILQGQKIYDNPVESMNEYAKMINKQVATDLGLTISDELMEQYVIIGETN